MSRWHVWGDFVHTRPEFIGRAKTLPGRSADARASADANGFDFERRTRNGFEPWAEAYESDGDADQEFEFASCPVVRGWKKI